jgi:hypothetical protein
MKTPPLTTTARHLAHANPHRIEIFTDLRRNALDGGFGITHPTPQKFEHTFDLAEAA